MATQLEYTDESIMPFGQHRKKAFEDIPDKWFKQYWYQNQSWYKEKKKGAAIETGLRGGKTYEMQRFAVCKYIEENFEEEDL